MAAAFRPAQPVELPKQFAIQIHHVLNDNIALSTAAPPTAASPVSTSPWHEPQPLEAQLDGLLAQHQPVSLQSIALIHARLTQEIQTCQQTINSLTVKLQHETDANRMADVQNAIAALLSQLNLIREKAIESETVVKEITRDIRSLDVAKRNVVASMTALKRLQMLVNGVDQLERLTETKRYREAASALQAVKSLLDFFQSYKGVERIAAAYKQVNDLQAQLRTSAMHDYEQFFLHHAPTRSVRSTGLADAALVLDAVGPEARNALVEWYCALQLREYRRIFRATDEAGQLDNVSRRYAWFRRVLKAHDDEHAPAFLKAWQVERWLVRRFADITGEDLQSVLIREQGRLNVATLLEALNATLDFEAAIARKFGMPFEDVVAPPLPSPPPPGNQQQQPVMASASSAVGAAEGKTMSSVFDPHLIVFVEAQDRTLAEMFQAYRRQGVSLSSAGGDRGQGGGGGGGFGADGLFGGGGASSGGGGGAEPGAPGGVNDGSGGSGGNENSGGGGGSSGTVLPSSTELFYFYRQTLEQCARLSNREPFKELATVYRKWLRIYADDVLRTALLRSNANEPSVRRSIDVRPNLSDLQKWCLVLNTADYCASTCSQLEDKIKEKIHPDFKDGVTLEEEREIFTGLISYAVQTLAREFEQCSEPIWNAMLRPQPPAKAWSQLRQTLGCASAYVGDLSSLLEQVGVVMRQDTENKRFVRSWCDKVVAVVVGRFVNVVVRLRPIGAVVAEQLLVDLAEIRKRLEVLPRYPAEDGWGVGASSSSSSSAHATASASYKRYVAKMTGRVETLLRVILAPVSIHTSTSSPNETTTTTTTQNLTSPVSPAPPTMDLLETYRLEIRDRSYSNFQKILDLKGIRKVEGNELVDRFLSDSRPLSPPLPPSSTSSLEMESWLNKLDLDPASTFTVLLSGYDGTYTPPTSTGTGRSSLNLGLNRSGSLFAAVEGGRNVLTGTITTSAGTTGGATGGGATTGEGAGSRALSDLRRFGSMFGGAFRRGEI